MQRVAVVDHGTGNLRSVARALCAVGGDDVEIEITDSADHLRAADRIVFPGQGAMGQCLHRLRERRLEPVIRECLEHKPFLGICLGLQVLARYTEEDGGRQGLGILQGRVRRFPDGISDARDRRCKIPHMGWNRVRFRAEHPLLHGIETGEYFYFVHSYYLEDEDVPETIAITSYAADFTSVAASNGWFATQFHPEKSDRAGLTLIRNFLHWNG